MTELESENATFRRMYAELALGNAAFKEPWSENCRAVREATGSRGSCEGTRVIDRSRPPTSGMKVAGSCDDKW
jgi:hypothetical protein